MSSGDLFASDVEPETLQPLSSHRQHTPTEGGNFLLPRRGGFTPTPRRSTELAGLTTSQKRNDEEEEREVQRRAAAARGAGSSARAESGITLQDRWHGLGLGDWPIRRA